MTPSAIFSSGWTENTLQGCRSKAGRGRVVGECRTGTRLLHSQRLCSAASCRAASTTHRSFSCTKGSAAAGSVGATNTRLVLARSYSRGTAALAAEVCSLRRRRRR